MHRLHLFLASVDSFLQTNPSDTLLRLTVVSAEQHGFRYCFKAGGNKALVAQATRQMSPLEVLIVQALADGAWHKGVEVALVCGYARDNAFSVIMGNLVEANILESGHFGYRLKRPESSP